MKQPLNTTTHRQSPTSPERTTHLLTVPQIVDRHAGLSTGGVRHMISTKGLSLRGKA